MYHYDDEQVQRHKLEYEQARMARRDAWVIANGGTEQPFQAADKNWYVYVHNFRTGKHGYLGLHNDVVIDNVEVVL